MIWLDVDTAINVPVNVLALIDDTDFKTRETGIVYNQAGMDLVWNFVTTAGVTTQAAVTPTTAGDYDWAHSGDAMYKIEMPASGGASANNDTEGHGWFSGICTGVLAWSGPVFGFRAAALNNALIDGGDVLDTNVTEISGDSTSADNLEAQYDGAGLTGDTFPANQAQLSGIANVGSASHQKFTGEVLTTPATTTGGSYADTEEFDSVYMYWDAVTGGFENELTTNIGSGIPSGIKISGYLQGSNDTLRVQQWDYQAGTPAWKTIGTWKGFNPIVDQVLPLDAFIGYVGIGANKGDIRIRLYNDNGGTDTALTGANIYIDQVFVEFNSGAASVLDRIYLDTNASNTNTVPGQDGIPGNPVSTMGAVNTLLTSTGLKRIEVAPVSSVILTATQSNQVFSGENWLLALGSQNIAGSHFTGAHVSGIASGTGTEQTFEKCHMDTSSHIKETHFLECGMAGTQTVVEAGEYHYDRCHSSIAGTGTWIFDFGAAIGNTNLSWRNGSGGIQLESMGDTGTDAASIEGRGQVVEGTCTGGTVAIRGPFTTTGITNLTLSDNARLDTLQINAECDSALADYDGPTNAEMIARTLLAADYFDFTTDDVTVGDYAATKAPNTMVWSDLLTGYSGNMAGLLLKKLLVQIATDGAVDDAAATRTSFITNITGAPSLADQTLVFENHGSTVNGGQGHIIETHDINTGEMTFFGDGFDTAPTDGDTLVVFALGGRTATDLKALVLDAITDDATRFSGADIALIVEDTNELQTDDVPGLIAAHDSSIDTQLNAIGVIVTAIQAITDAIPNSGAMTSIGQEDTLTAMKGAGWTSESLKSISDAVAALNNLDAATVNAELVDVLTVDTHVELAVIPPATASFLQMVQLVFMATRNGGTFTAATGAQTIENDAGTSIGTATVTDDGLVTDHGKFS